MTRRRVLVVNVVGLTPRLLTSMPRLSALAAAGWEVPLETVFPAVTCSVQSTMLTGLPPGDTGIVGNGWYFRELGEVFLWRQHNALVEGEKVWDTARRLDPGFTTANVCWWYAMGATTDYLVTPRPVYHADGRKSPDCYTHPVGLHDELTSRLGAFPLFQYWGPTAAIESSEWIADATRSVMARHDVDLTLAYLPHLDYDLQRYGPDGPEAVAAARQIDDVAGRLVEDAIASGTAVVVLSEYGITPVRRTVDINRHLRRAGLLDVYTQDGMEYLDPWVSSAFAVADHQIAHVYVRARGRIAEVRDLLEDIDGIDEVLDSPGKQRMGVDHERSGELVAIAERDSWFTYYYWLDDERAPDFARTVDIHRKPGYDPVELFFDPTDRTAKAKAGLALLGRKAGLRTVMKVVSLDPAPVQGSHGRLPDDDDSGPVLICSDPETRRERIAAAEVKDLMLELAGLDGSG